MQSRFAPLLCCSVLTLTSSCFLFPQAPVPSPCATGNGGCSENATCSLNAESQATCACNGGYIGDGKTCSPELTGPCSSAQCDPHATCSASNGTAVCTCDNGYSGNGTTCAPVGGSACSPDPCSVHATCSEASDGGAVCTCDSGYSGDGFDCTPVNGITDAGPGLDAGPGPDAGSCDAFSNETQECRSCVETACSSDVSAFESDCSAYNTCLCNCGANSNCPSACSNQITTACSNDLSTLDSCAQQDCATSCGLTPDAGLPPSDAGLSAFPDGGTWCTALSACCPTLDQIEPGLDCDTLASGNDQSECEQLVGELAGLCP